MERLIPIMAANVALLERFLPGLLPSVNASIILAPLIKEGFCHYVFLVSVEATRTSTVWAKKPSSWTQLFEQLRWNQEKRFSCLATLGSINKTQVQLRLISKDANANFRTLYLRFLDNMIGVTSGHQIF